MRGKKASQTRRAKSSRPFVVIVTRPHEELEPQVAEALLAEARQRNWILLNPRLSDGDLPQHQKPSGAIITTLPDDRIPTKLRAMNVPLVRLGRLPHPDDPVVPAVYPDHGAAGRLAAQYFIQRGFRELGCITHIGSDAMNMTLGAYRLVGESHGCRVHAHLLRNPADRDAHTDAQRFEKRMREIAAWLDRVPKPIAILVNADVLAAQTILMCQQAGHAVPEKVAVMGIGNEEVWCEMAPVPISSIDMDRREMTRTAVQLLDDLMKRKRPAASRTLVPPSRIVTRRSTDILAVEDTMVARAIRYVWDNLDQDLSVDDVARAMTVPRHKLDRAFRKNLGRGVKAELIRIRMERCCELLRTTDTAIAQLSTQLGYRTPQYFHNAFKKAYGISPRQYRLNARHERTDAAPV